MHERLRRVCFIDYDREIALVVALQNRDGKHQILGVGRLIKEHGTDEAEFAVLISDPWQGKDFGSEVLKLLVQIGRKEALRRITGHISPENTTMKTVSKQVGFNLHFDREAFGVDSQRRRVRAAAHFSECNHHRPPGFLHARSLVEHRGYDHRQHHEVRGQSAA